VDNSSPEDLQKEISRLWEKVGAASGAASFDVAPASSMGTFNDVAWETVAMLKSQYRRQERRWAELLDAREAALRALKERQGLMETELAALRERARTDDERVMAEVLDVGSRLDAAQKALEAERSNHERERRELRELADAARESVAAEAARWREEERRWQKKEQQYLLDLKELQALSGRRQEESARAEDSSRRYSDSLKEAKAALEKTLAELLRERRVRQETEEERAKAVKKISEVEKHFEELSRIWEEERAQWRELWDRERSAWESQRLEFSAWEENLRREREAWHSEITVKDQAQVKFAEQLTRNLRDSSATSEKLVAVMGRIAQLENRPAGAAPPQPRPSRWRKAWPALALCCLFAALVLPLGRWFAAWTLKPLSIQNFALDNPTAMSAEGRLLWVSDWKGTLSVYDPQDLRSPARSASVVGIGAYRPVAVAVGREIFYTLDAAQARVVRHRPDDPGSVLYAKAAPGPAPAALAWDGKALWSYDAVNKTLYRHGADESNAKAYPLEGDVVPTVLQWIKGKLWLYDSRSRRLKAYLFANDAFTPLFSLDPEETVIGLAAAQGRPSSPEGAAGADEVFILAGPTAQRQGFSLVRYRCGRRIFTIF